MGYGKGDRRGYRLDGLEVVAVNGNGLGREGETLAVVGDGGVKWKKGFRERKVIRRFFFPSKEDSFILGHWMIVSTCHVINRKGIEVILDFLSTELELQKSAKS